MKSSLSTSTQQRVNSPLFAMGFRVFFVLASASALLLILVWNALFNAELKFSNYFSSTTWHAHEMLLGYAVAVIAGFLLTAVKNWTGKTTLEGDHLAALALLWVYGRILPFYSGLLPDAMIALVDMAFLPILMIFIGRAMLQAKYYQGSIYLLMLALMTTGNALIHGEQLGLFTHTATIGLQGVLATLVLMMVVVTGKVVPFFIERALSGTLILRRPLLDGCALSSAVLLFITQLVGGAPALIILFALITAGLHSLRLAGWYVPRIRYVPLLWVLCVGYAWIIIGFLLTALAALGWCAASLALHAFTVGGIGVLSIGMMARVALGHTGRALRVSNAITLAFVFINLAALCRVLLPLTWLNGYNYFIYVATLCWLAAFALFVVIYWPILVKPRADGQLG
ncbi:MAG: NnrS family protein [Methylovulum sp.]|nr:NnrS family protein [Methylovulum sp.]TSA40144.1 MAG: NnrS family protein [Methylococcaceae bacterium]